MQSDQISVTAIAASFLRANHHLHDSPHVFNDFCAHLLIQPDEWRRGEDMMIEGLRRIDPALVESIDRREAVKLALRRSPAPAVMLSRARYTEDMLQEAIQRGVTQYVILGAGLDTYAVRAVRPGSPLIVFEVDHPGMQASKRERLATAGLRVPPNLHFVPADFERETVAQALSRFAFDSTALSFFSWLGMTMYLSRAAVVATLQSIRKVAASGSELVFDYMDCDAFVPEKASERVTQMIALTRTLGEPQQTGFDPTALVGELSAAGLVLLEDLGPSEIQDRYFSGRIDGYTATEHFHFARAAVA